MPGIGSRCHELRINDGDSTWRIIYRTDDDAVPILDVFQKKTSKTPPVLIENCRRRARKYDQDAREEG
jgi:phage-related protein